MGLNNSFLSTAKRFVKFCISGFVATCVHFLLLYLAIEYFFIYPVAATVIAFVGAFQVSLIFSWFWVFRKIRRNLSAYTSHIIIAIIGLGLNSVIMYVAVELIDLDYKIGFAAGVMISPLLTFLMLSRFVYYGSVAQIDGQRSDTLLK